MPRSSSCSPWINGTEVQALPSIQAAIAKASSPQKTSGITLSSEQINAICAECAAAATEVLYSLSGKVLTGECGPVTIRPLARPADVDARILARQRRRVGERLHLRLGRLVRHGRRRSRVALRHLDASRAGAAGLPGELIVQVLIDGVVIPPEEYELRDHRTLVRLRPTPSYVPTERYGWPTAQVEDLPDSEMGTFSA